LLRVTDVPVYSCLPEGAPIVKISTKGLLIDNLPGFFKDQVLNESKSLVAILNNSPAVDTNASNKVALLPVREHIALSNYDLTSPCSCFKLCFAMEELWDVL
jgi:hypothetical protein